MSMYRFLSSLRFRLMLLVLLALVPAFVLVIYSAAEQRRLVTEQAQGNVLRLARVAASNQQQIIESTRHFLVTLAQFPQLHEPDPVPCSQLLRDVLTHYPEYTQLGVVEPDGTVRCTAVPDAAPVNDAREAYFQRTLASKNFSIGEFRLGRISGKSVLPFGYPILNAGSQVQVVLFAALDLGSLNQLAAQVLLPVGSTISLQTRQGTILARYPDPTKWVGQTYNNSSIAAIITSPGGEGTVETSGIDGAVRLYAVTPLRGEPAGDLFVRVGIPTAIAFAEVDQALVRNLLALGGVALLTLATTWIGGDVFLLRAVNALVHASREVAAGNSVPTTREHYGGGELSELAQAFDQMVEKLQERERTLQHDERMRAQLLHRVITAHEDERMRIARELHDETSQSLAALMVSLDTARLALAGDSQRAAERLEMTKLIADGILDNIHRIIADLRPSLLDDLGLVPAITSYGEKRLNPLGITFQMQENNLDQRLPRSIETVLFRIAQEAITNAARHSGASAVQVGLTRADGHLILQVADNGAGFDLSHQTLDAHGKGLGLRGMAERVSILGGELKIQTELQKGTVITVQVGLPSKDDHVQDSRAVSG